MMPSETLQKTEKVVIKILVIGGAERVRIYTINQLARCCCKATLLRAVKEIFPLRLLASAESCYR